MSAELHGRHCDQGPERAREDVHTPGEAKQQGLASSWTSSRVRPFWRTSILVDFHSGVRQYDFSACSEPSAVVSTPDEHGQTLHWRTSTSGSGGGMSTAVRLDEYVLPNHMDLCSPCYNTRASDRTSAESGRRVMENYGRRRRFAIQEARRGKG